MQQSKKAKFQISILCLFLSTLMPQGQAASKGAATHVSDGKIVFLQVGSLGEGNVDPSYTVSAQIVGLGNKRIKLNSSESIFAPGTLVLEDVSTAPLEVLLKQLMRAQKNFNSTVNWGEAAFNFTSCERQSYEVRTSYSYRVSGSKNSQVTSVLLDDPNLLTKLKWKAATCESYDFAKPKLTIQL